MKKIKVYYFVPIIIITIAILWAPNRQAGKGVNYSKISFGDIVLDLEVAETNRERIKGLSGRKSLRENSGLLFIFPQEDFYGIWMKEMNFPIDIIWLSDDLRVVSIKTEVAPESYPEVFRPNIKSLYVLEVNSGLTRKTQIEVGDLAELF